MSCMVWKLTTVPLGHQRRYKASAQDNAGTTGAKQHSKNFSAEMKQQNYNEMHTVKFPSYSLQRKKKYFNDGARTSYLSDLSSAFCSPWLGPQTSPEKPA